MAGFQLPEESRQKFMQALQTQGGGPVEGLSPEQQQQIVNQGAQAAAADMGGQGGADTPPAEAPQGEPAPQQPGAPAIPASVQGQDQQVTEALRNIGVGSVQELIEKFMAISEGFGQLKDEHEQLLGFRQAINNTEELDPKDPDYGTKKVFREMLGPVADEFTKTAKLKLLAEAWNLDARGLADAEELMPEINAHIQKNPGLSQDPTGFRQAYNAVKAGKHRSEDQLFADPSFIEKASKHPEIMKAVTKAYLENLARNGEVPPAVGQGGNTPFSGAPAKPKTVAEANAALGRLLGVRK